MHNSLIFFAHYQKACKQVFKHLFMYLFTPLLFIYTAKTIKGVDRIKPQVTSDQINSLPDSTSNLPTSEHVNQMDNLILHQESPKPFLR